MINRNILFNATLVGILFYLAGAFASASFNLSEWPEGTRITVAIFATTAIAIVTVITWFLTDTKK